MSLVGVRERIGMALSTVDGVTGWAWRPSAPKTGDAWPVQGPGDRDSGTAFMVTWAVRVFVPQDERQASEWWDQHWPSLFYALHLNVGFVDRFEPVTLAAAGGEQLAYQITIRAEE